MNISSSTYEDEIWRCDKLNSACEIVYRESQTWNRKQIRYYYKSSEFSKSIALVNRFLYYFQFILNSISNWILSSINYWILMYHIPSLIWWTLSVAKVFYYYHLICRVVWMNGTTTHSLVGLSFFLLKGFIMVAV